MLLRVLLLVQLTVVACGGRSTSPKPVPPPRLSALSKEVYAKYLRGRAFFHVGKLARAVEELRGAQAAAPQELGIHGAYLEALFDAGMHVEAQDVSQESETLWGNRWEYWFARGQLLAKLRQHSEALVALRAAWDKSETAELSIALAIAESFSAEEKYNEAEHFLLGLDKEVRGQLEVQFELAEVTLAQKKWELALAHAQSVIKSSPQELNSHAMAYIALVRLGRDNAAQRVLRAPFDRDSTVPGIAEALVEAIADYASVELARKAPTILNRDDLPVSAQKELAWIELHLGMPTQAIARIQKAFPASAATAPPSEGLDPDATDTEARALWSLGKSDEAAALLSTVIPNLAREKDRNSLRALRLEILSTSSPDSDEVRQLLAETAEIDHLDLQVARANALVRLGQGEDAHALLTEQISRHPGATRLRYSLAELLRARGSAQEAAKLIEPLLVEAPRDTLALNYLGYLYSTDPAQRQRSRSLLLRALARSPQSAFVLDSYGFYLLQDPTPTNLKKAERYLERAFRLSPSEPEMCAHLAELRWRQGKAEEAMSLRKKALQMAPDPLIRRRISARWTTVVGATP